MGTLSGRGGYSLQRFRNCRMSLTVAGEDPAQRLLGARRIKNTGQQFTHVLPLCDTPTYEFQAPASTRLHLGSRRLCLVRDRSRQR